MKKLLALVLVLGLATVANATVISISGPTSLAAGETGSYTVSYDNPDALGSFDMDLTADDAAKGTLGNFAIIATGRDTAVDWIGDPIGANANGKEVSTFLNAVGTGLGGNLLTFDLTATGSAGQVITLAMEGWAFFDKTANAVDPMPTLTGLDVTITPEPITLALLGLGGLFIRRK